MKREYTAAHFNMRRWMIGLAASGAASLLTGFAGVALGLPEWVFLLFVAMAFACTGLAMLFVEHLTVAREAREAAEEPVLVFRPLRVSRGEGQFLEVERDINRRIEMALLGRERGGIQ